MGFLQFSSTQRWLLYIYTEIRCHTFRTRGNNTCRLHRPSLDINIRRQPTGPRLTSYVSSGDNTSSQQIDWQQVLGITRLLSAGYCFSTMSTNFPNRAPGPGTSVHDVNSIELLYLFSFSCDQWFVRRAVPIEIETPACFRWAASQD